MLPSWRQRQTDRFPANHRRDCDNEHILLLTTLNSDESPEDARETIEFVSRYTPFLNRSVISGT